MLYVALTGQDLFGAESYAEVVLNVLKKRIPPPSEHGAPACFDEVLRHALSRAREGRFETASAMAQALVAATSDESMLASPAEVGAYVRREFGELLDERRRRLQRAVDGESTSRVSTFHLDLSSGGAEKEKKNASTLFIPAAGDDDDDESGPVRDRRRSSSSGVRVLGRHTGSLRPLLRVLAQEKGAIALSVAACTIVIVVLALMGQRGSAAPKAQRPTAATQAASR